MGIFDLSHSFDNCSCHPVAGFVADPYLPSFAGFASLEFGNCFVSSKNSFRISYFIITLLFLPGRILPSDQNSYFGCSYDVVVASLRVVAFAFVADAAAAASKINVFSTNQIVRYRTNFVDEH